MEVSQSKKNESKDPRIDMSQVTHKTSQIDLIIFKFLTHQNELINNK